MTEKEIIGMLALPANSINKGHIMSGYSGTEEYIYAPLFINVRALVVLAIANTEWISLKKEFFDFHKETDKIIEEIGYMKIYLDFIESFQKLNREELKTNREFAKGWKNRGTFNGFIYGLLDAEIITKELKNKCFDIQNKFLREEWSAMLSGNTI